MPNTGSDSPAPNGDNAPPPAPNLFETIAAMLTERDEQTALFRELVQQDSAPWHGNHNHQPLVPGYSATAFP